jgi:hypothetical protein
MKGMVQIAESLSKHYWIFSKALMPIVRSEQGPTSDFAFARTS